MKLCTCPSPLNQSECPERTDKGMCDADDVPEFKVTDKVVFRETGDVGTVTKVHLWRGTITDLEVNWDDGTGWAKYAASYFDHYKD